MARDALISVSDKTGIEKLGHALNDRGWRLLSTGGTATRLRESGCDVVDISDFTGFPEILDGRVKTLHPRVFAGILAAPSPDHRNQLAELDLGEIDLVVVNLYPFRETVSREDVRLESAIENIDIGGPSLIRAAAKNHQRVTVVVDPEDYDAIVAELESDGPSLERRQKLACKAFRHTAAYDAAISAHLPVLMGQVPRLDIAALIAESLLGATETSLRYGENPHQWGALLTTQPPRGLAGARQLQGKEISYNNLGDTTGAWRLVWDLPGAGVAVIKHGNPCGVAVGEDMKETFVKARETDPMSAFGGVIVANRPVDEDFAKEVTKNFAEVVVAPGFTEAALAEFRRKKNLRVLEAASPAHDPVAVRSIDGGFLVQAADLEWEGEKREIATKRKPNDDEVNALELAWRVVKHVGSNAIVVGNEGQILGIGAGQMSRVDAARLAVSKAREMGHDMDGSVAGSDAFFPFADGVESLYKAGVRAVIQPGGSIRDAEVVEACDRLGMAMVFTGRRHFRH
jgi:phosphoribosylaminoimidazolecarboxamide formyltransferase/IMP cyclohydrolase